MQKNTANGKIDGAFLDNANVAYDATAKKFLSRRIFLARIIKRCIKEFADFSVEDIANKYIEGEPELGTIPLAPDRTNAVRKITGDNVEYKTLTEGETTFDIRVTVYLPQENERIKLIINIEAQKKYNPGYSLIKRGIFHGSRLMSAQYNVEFVEPHFNDIKKVVSIWICMTSPDRDGSGITEYRFTEYTVVGNISKPTQEYDLIQLVMVYLRRDGSLIEDELLKLLHLIFCAQLNATMKKERLKSEFGIELDNTALKEVNIMCNLSEGIAEAAREENTKELTLNYLRNMLKNTKMTLEQAMDTLELPADSRSMYASLIR